MRRYIFVLLWMLGLAGCAGLGGEPEIVATIARTETSLESAWRPTIAAGARIFAERCTECHGSSGDGRGDLVVAGSVSQPIDMTDHELVAAKAPLEWYEIISEGKIENLMPPWENALSERERWDVTLYTYTLGYTDALLAAGERIWAEGCADCALPDAIPPIFSDAFYGEQLNQTHFGSVLGADDILAAVAYARMAALESSDSAPQGSLPRGVFRGRVEHGTTGAVVPADTPLQLQYGSSAAGFAFAETKAAEDGSFAFADIPLTSAFSYVVSAVYDGRLFSVRVPAGHADKFDVTITLYDATDDPDVVSVSHIELFIEPVTLADLGPGLTVTEIIRYRNDSDRIYTSGRGFDDGREAVLLLQFPRGARLLSGDGSGRYVVIEGIENLPNSLIDTQPVAPGDAHEVVQEYFIAYQESLRFEQTFNNAIAAEIRVTLAEGLRIESELLRSEGKDSLHETFEVYKGALQMTRDARLNFGISGDPFATSSDDETLVTSETLPALFIGGIVLATVLGVGLSLLRRRSATPAGGIERLVQELARLDADHDQGRINHDLWHHRRRELKERLAQLMAEDGVER